MAQNNRNKRSVLLWLILIIIIAAFFRLWQIGSVPPGLYPDEAMNGNNALEALQTGEFKVFYPENNGREGLYVNIIAVSLKIFGNKTWALRLPSAIFGIFTVLGIFLLTRQLFSISSPQNQNAKIKNQNDNSKLKNYKFNLEQNERIALLASFFLGASFWHINFSRIGFRAIMAPFFLVWGIYFLLLAFEKIKSSDQNIKIVFFSILGGTLYGLGFHTYIAYRVTPAIVLILMFSYWFSNRKIINNKKFLLATAGYLLATAVIILPLAFYFYNNPQDFLGRTSQISIFSAENPLAELGKNVLKTAGMFWFKGDYNWRHNYAGSPQLWWPVGLLFGLGILMSLKVIIQNAKIKMQNYNSKLKNLKIGNSLEIGNLELEIGKNILPEILLFTWLIVGLLPVIISSEGIPHALRAIIVLPPVMIISAIGLEWLLSKIQSWLAKQTKKYVEYAQKLNRIKKELLVLLFVFFIGILTHAYNQYFSRWTNHPDVYYSFNQNYVEIGDYLNSLPNDLPKYIIVNASGVNVHEIPMPSQTVMFITKTYLPEWQKEKNIYYILPENINRLSDSLRLSESQLVITMLETDPFLRAELKDKIPGLRAESSPGFTILKKIKK